MAATATDITHLIRTDRTRPDSASVAHLLAATLFLGVGAVAAGLALISMIFPAFLPLGYGLWRAITMLAMVLGFTTLAAIGGSFYVLPRLTGSRLWNEKLAWGSLLLVALSTALGIVVVGAGLGDGQEPFALPWWLDVPVLVGLTIPLLVGVQTVKNRTEPSTYISVFFVLTGLGALPLLYLAGNMVGLRPVAQAIGNMYFSSAYLVALLLMAIGLALYAVVKESERPLAGRQLPQIAFWSLLFGAGWFGIAQLLGGPVPAWLGTVAAVLGLGFPVGMAASTFHLFSTLEGGWQSKDQPEPVALLTLAGLIVGTVAAILAAMAGFRSTGNLVAFTSYWEGIVYGLVLGAFPLITGATMIQAIPRMTGRSLFSHALALRAVKLTTLGAGGVLVSLVVAGLVSGYAWAGGAFTGAYAAVGGGWSPAAGPAQVFLGIGTVAGLVAVAGNLTIASLVIRTLTRGKVTTQEVLVERGEP